MSAVTSSSQVRISTVMLTVRVQSSKWVLEPAVDVVVPSSRNRAWSLAAIRPSPRTFNCSPESYAYGVATANSTAGRA